MIDNLINEEELPDSPEKTNDEKLVELLEAVGLQEGHDFCYDEGEILLPDELDVEDTEVDYNKIKDLNTKWPNISIESTGKSFVASYIDNEDNKQTCVLPLSVSQLLMFHSG